MSEQWDENLTNSHTDDLGDRSNQNVANLIRFFYKYSIDKLRSICVDDYDFDVVGQELSKLLLEVIVIPNLREWDGTSPLVLDAVLLDKIKFATIKPYMTSKWIRLSQSYFKLCSTPLEDLYKVYTKWLENRVRIRDEDQFKRHMKCVNLLKRLLYITRTIGYVIDEATVAMKIYDIYKLITIMIKNGVIPPIELFCHVLNRHLVQVN